MKPLTVGSVCSGMGALELGLALWLGADAIDVRWHAEVDPDASRVLKTWWPEVPNLGDFTVPNWPAERVDVECGGVPCQGFSAAGRQLGAADPRHLWPDWRRGIAERRPATVVFENVANLVRGKMRPIFNGIIADLLALGYDVRWCLLGACAVGAAHHRHRVFLLACRTRTTPNVAEVKVQTCGQHAAAYLPAPRVSATRTSFNAATAAHSRSSPSLDQALEIARGELPREFANWSQLPPSWQRLELLPTTTARDANTRGEGGPEFWEAKRAAGWTGGIPLGAALSLLPTPRGIDGSNGGPNQGIASGDIALSSAVQPERWGKYAEAIARHEAVLGRPAPEPTEVGPRGGRRLAAAFSEWLMMLPEGHLTSVLPRNPALARAGNGVVPPQAATALRLLLADLTGRG